LCANTFERDDSASEVGDGCLVELARHPTRGAECVGYSLAAVATDQLRKSIVHQLAHRDE
jgi:hypothetical protein